MKLPRVHLRGLRAGAWWEHVLRFVFGGLVTASAGLVAHRFGPVVGGLFLAFPAILPASLTLVKEHDGRRSAVNDARGARIGAVALAAFAVCVAATAIPLGAWCLPLAAGVWGVVGVALWSAFHGSERSEP